LPSWPSWLSKTYLKSDHFSGGGSVAETDKAYEIKAELPGLDEKDIEVKVANGVLSIKGEKQEEKEREGERLPST
jgi:HSP20 family molecular chaperone IbpA